MRKGFTIIELVVSVSILIIAVFAINNLLTQGVSAARRSEKLTVAVNLAQAQIETILSEQYTNLPVGTYEARHVVFQNYYRKTLISFIDPATLQTITTDLGLKKVNTTVYYQIPGKEKSYTLSTIITQQ